MPKIEPDTALNLFKEQLGNQIPKLVEQHQLDNAGQGLIYWYFMNILGLNSSEVAAIVCDGGGDLGIDAILIDDSDRVHFFQFKNPKEITSSFQTVDVDKVLSGLNLIMAKNYDKIANDELKDRIKEIYTTVATGYTLHIVTSGSGIEGDAHVKLNSFIKEGFSHGDGVFVYQIEDLKWLYDRFYTRNLPTIEKQVKLVPERSPYMVRSADHDSYTFHQTGTALAQLYGEYGEQLLQQNIRVFEGDNSTNRSVYEACTSDQSSNFYHYNNGVTFLCKEASWDNFTACLTVTSAQVVNGGQTIRMLHKAYKEEKLRGDVYVAVRVITAQGDKEFAGNVAVNLNNQTRVESSFLRSNDPRVIQLASSLASLGWYLERREGERPSLSVEDLAKIEAKLCRALTDENTIGLKEGAQAYAATYCRRPDIAKKDPKLLFLNDRDGGHFSRIFNTEITAERFISSFRLMKMIEQYIDRFKALKRRKSRLENWRADYAALLGPEIIEKYGDQVDQALPQCVTFLAALVFDHYCTHLNGSPSEVLQKISVSGPSILSVTLLKVFEYAQISGDHPSKSWPTLMKSLAFFQQVGAYMKGQANAQ